MILETTDRLRSDPVQPLRSTLGKREDDGIEVFVDARVEEPRTDARIPSASRCEYGVSIGTDVPCAPWSHEHRLRIDAEVRLCRACERFTG